MQAVILVGGEGTRLRPLTSTVPKPVVPLVDRPFISFMLEWLREHGVDDVIMSCGFLATSVRNVLGDGSALGIRLRFVEEPEPRGTAGALKFAESMLDERFLMLNGDVLTDIDLTRRSPSTSAPARRRRSRSCRWPTRPPTAWCTSPRTARCRDFVEKPSSDRIDTNLISAGAYVLEREILELVPPDRNVSIEREVWPLLVGDGLYGFPSESYWLDIGTPERYLQGTFDIIEGNVADGGARAARRATGWRSTRAPRCRPGDPAGGDRARRARRRGRARRQPGGARRGRLGRRRHARSSARGPQRRGDRRGCTLRDCIVAAGCRVGAAPDHRRGGARRGRDRRGGQRDRRAGRVSSRA